MAFRSTRKKTIDNRCGHRNYMSRDHRIRTKQTLHSTHLRRAGKGSEDGTRRRGGERRPEVRHVDEPRACFDVVGVQVRVHTCRREGKDRSEVKAQVQGQEHARSCGLRS